MLKDDNCEIQSALNSIENGEFDLWCFYCKKGFAVSDVTEVVITRVFKGEEKYVAKCPYCNEGGQLGANPDKDPTDSFERAKKHCDRLYLMQRHFARDN